MKTAKIIVTGERTIEASVCLNDGRQVEWQSIPVLDFERISVPREVISSFIETPCDWILFSSPRAVQFWSETLAEHQLEFPLETQVACIGETTAKAAEAFGYFADFYPTSPGSEIFLKEFESMISLSANRPTVLIPASVIGRRLMETSLRELGCTVTHLAIYKTKPIADLSHRVSSDILDNAAAYLFTSPSSVESFLASFKLQAGVPIVAMGEYTAASLKDRGLLPRLLPEGEYQKIGEVLC